MNKFIILGRLCADPEINYSGDGKAVARFNFAVNRRFKRDGEAEADFFNCVVFGKAAETFEKCNISKGTKLLIEGEMRSNNYTDRDGVKRYGMQVVVNSFEFCESKGNAGQQQETPSPYGAADENGFMNVPDGLDEGLPFS